MAPRLRSDMQASALQRQAEGQGLMVSVLKKGHEEGGILFVKWVEGREALVFQESVVDDARRWRRRGEGAMPEAEANLMLRGEEDFDPDLWIIEISGSFAKVDTLLDPAD